MPPFAISDVRWRGVAAAVPATTVDNERLGLLAGAKGRAFVETVGIRTRRVAPPSTCASDLCVAAATALLSRLEIEAASIGALVFVTQTPDFPIPGNSTLVQQRLGLARSTCLLDLTQGCAGYVYGLVALAGLMRAARIARGLLLVGDTITRLVSPEDRSTAPIFSDAGSATCLELSDGAPVMHFHLGSDGQGAHVIRVRAGGAREPFGPSSLAPESDGTDVWRAPVHLAMRGLDVLQYSLQHVAGNVQALLAEAGGPTPDYYVLHQANRVLNDSLLRKLGVPREKAPQTLSEYGNTSCASIPVTLCARLGAALAHDSRTLLLSGFGSGFSWGSALITTERLVCPDVIEVAAPDAPVA